MATPINHGFLSRATGEADPDGEAGSGTGTGSGSGTGERQKARGPRTGKGKGPAEASYFALTQDLAVSLILVLPLLVAYQVGLVWTGLRVINGADFVTRIVYPEFGMKGLVLANLTFVAVFLAAIIRLERQKRFRPSLFPPLVLESAVYASVLGSLIVFIMQRSFILAVDFDGSLRAFVLSIGAGVNEEIVFRLFLLGFLQYLFADFAGLKDRPAAVVSVIVSSALFSGAHYVGSHGEALQLASFVYRFLAGVIFALIYRYRSFAVAVYTHAIYDILVLVL